MFPDLKTAVQSMNVVGVSCIMPVLLPAEEISLVNLTPHSCTTLDCPPLKGLHHVERGEGSLIATVF